MGALDDLPARIRAFIAIEANAEIARAVDTLTGELRTPHDAINWIRSTNLHLTIRFLGDAVDSLRIPPFIDGLEQIAARTEPFVIRLRGTGAFPGLDRPRVLWIGLESPELVALAGRVEAAAVACGFEADPRPYSPHLTIGRVRAPHRFREIRPAFERYADRDFGIIEACAMTLYRSVLSPDGANHHAIATFGFGPSPRA